MKTLFFIIIFCGLLAFGYYKYKQIQDANLLSGNKNSGGGLDNKQYSNDSTVNTSDYVSSGVIFYQDINYGGASSSPIPKGNYTLSQLKSFGFSNDWVSSLKVPKNWKVEAYKDDNFIGYIATYIANVPYVGDAYNDVISSLKIF